jgi:hypothetical protein
MDSIRRDLFPGLFEPVPPEVQAPKSLEVAPGCCYVCNHLKKKHCKSGIGHSSYKDQARMVKSPSISFCATMHCEEALCSCTSFAATEADVCPPNRRYGTPYIPRTQ